MSSEADINELLGRCSGGDESALDELFPIVMQELRRIAHAQMRNQLAGHTLQTTALVHEAYLKLVKQKNQMWADRSHFLAVASKVMRHILLDYAKANTREKRGGGAVHVEFDEAATVSFEKSAEIITLDAALERLSEVDPLKARVVEMRHFGGMTVEETAEALGVAPITIMRHWNLAKAWLRREISGE
ncbi:MAG TPA: sigma-70 family RNA polymerase sigma factor [Pyrinomonadaceae bacterium]